MVPISEKQDLGLHERHLQDTIPTLQTIPVQLDRNGSLTTNPLQATISTTLFLPIGESLPGQPFHVKLREELSSGSSGSLASSDSSMKSLDSSASGSFSKMTGTDFAASTGSVASLSANLINVVLFMIFACVYKAKVVDKAGQMPHQSRKFHHDFDFTLCDCLTHDCPNTCLMVSCCPFVRIAHTNAVADVCGFWQTICCLSIASFCPPAPCCLNVYFRMHIKDVMGLDDHCFNDMVLAFCCLPCITGQQALAVDTVMGYSVGCCCRLQWLSGAAGGGFQTQGGYDQASLMQERSGGYY
jgi:hypothetical protein